MLSIIGMIIAGAIIGALARLIMRGEQNISVLWTIVLGAVGALIGSTVAGFFGVAQTAGIDWIRWAVAEHVDTRLLCTRGFPRSAVLVTQAMAWRREDSPAGNVLLTARQS